MDKGFVILQVIVIFIIAAYIFFLIGFPIILDIVWIKRVKRGKSKLICPLGIIAVLYTVGSILNLPQTFTLIKDLFDWI